MEEYFVLENQIAARIAAGVISDDEFNADALRLFRFQRANNPPYENFCRHLGVPLELTDWRAIPAVPQSAFKQFSLRSFPASETVKTFRTSGTTGEGFGEHHFRSLRLYEAAILRGWDALALPVLPQIVLTPPPADAPFSSLSHMMGTLRQRAAGGDQQFCFEPPAMIDALARASTPVAVMGTALAFLHLFEELAKTNTRLRLPPGSFALETGGYKGSGRSLSKAELYERFAHFLGLAPELVLNEYGMTELSSQFYTRGLGAVHREPAWVRAMVINPETRREAVLGAIGILKIVDLANVGSVLAVQTQDLAIRRADGFELIGRDPSALPRGCSRTADEMLARRNA